MSCECKNTNPVNHDSCHCNTFISPACGAPQHFQPQVDMSYYMHLISANQFLNLELNELKEELCLCAQEKKKLEEDNEKLNEEKEKLKEDNEKLQEEIEKLKKKIEDLEKEIADLKEELDKATNCDTLKDQLKAAQDSNLGLAEKLDKLKTAIQNAKDLEQLEDVKAKIAEKAFDSPTKPN